MEKGAFYFLLIPVLILSFFAAGSFGQNFTVTPLIDMPGKNIEFVVYSPSDGFRDNDYAYICWINVRDPIYIVYFKQISPVMEEPIVGQIERNAEGLADFMLYQNYPNPFNAVTKIR